MIPKSSGWSVLVQFAGYRTILTFLRKCVSLGCAAQLSTKRIICLFCAPFARLKNGRTNKKSTYNHGTIIHWRREAILSAWITASSSNIRLFSTDYLVSSVSSTVCIPWQKAKMICGVEGSHFKN